MKEEFRKCQGSGNDQRVTGHRLGRARAQITQKHRDVTREHRCKMTDRIWELKIITINKTGR